MISSRKLHDELLRAHGRQEWWPARSRFEICVGAILVQRTSWSNAEKAIAILRQQGLIRPQNLALAEEESIRQCIRSAGFYRMKSARLRRFAGFVCEQGGMDRLARHETGELRKQLLALDGIGAETADSILLYAFDRPVAVIDAYLRRLWARLAGQTEPASDPELRQWSTRTLSDAAALNELHALVVAHGKNFCRSKPDCAACVIRRRCASASPAPRSAAP